MTPLSIIFEQTRELMVSAPFYAGGPHREANEVCLTIALARVTGLNDCSYLSAVGALRAIINPDFLSSVSLAEWNDTHGKAGVVTLLAQARDKHRVIEAHVLHVLDDLPDGVTAVSLDDPAALHKTIDDHVG